MEEELALCKGCCALFLPNLKKKQVYCTEACKKNYYTKRYYWKIKNTYGVTPERLKRQARIRARKERTNAV